MGNGRRFLFYFRVLSVLCGQHLPFLSKSPLFKGISENQHLPSDLPYTSLRPPVTPPIIYLPSCTGGLWEVLSQDLPSRNTFIQRDFQRFREVLTHFCSVCYFFVSSVDHFCIFMHFVSFVSLVNSCLGLSLGQTWTFVRGNSHFPACKPPAPCLLSISAYIFNIIPSKIRLSLNPNRMKSPPSPVYD